MNNSLLKDIEYLNIVNSCIENVKKQYCLPVYETNNLENISDSDLQFTINDQLFWETVLMEIRGKTISYSSYRKKQQNNREDILKSSIAELEVEGVDIEELSKKKGTRNY